MLPYHRYLMAGVAPLIRRLKAPKLDHGDIIFPSEVEEVRPPFMLKGMIERITGTDGHSSLIYHLSSLQANTVTHAEVRRASQKRVYVARTGLLSWDSIDRYDKGLFKQILKEPYKALNQVRYCHNLLSYQYFGHWLTDSLTTALLEADYGIPWIPSSPVWQHAKQYEKRLDFANHGWDIIFAKNLISYQDFSQGSSKRERYRLLRERFKVDVEKPPLKPLYLKRGNTGSSRIILNEPQIINSFQKRGWVIADVAEETLSKLHSKISNANIIVSIEGSHISHVYFARSIGLQLVVLQPCDRFTTVHLGPCRANQIEMRMVIMNGSQGKGYLLDEGEVLRTIEFLS